MPTPSFLVDLIVLFALSIVVVLVFHQIRVPSIVGFLFTGVLAGPYGFALIRNVHDVEALAEVGVILLLFTVGLEFSLAQLSRIKRLLLVGGGVQVGVTLSIAMLLEHSFGASWPVSVFVAMLIALSSTAIVLRLLAEHAELDSAHGRLVLGILIFQDLCVVPMVLITPVLGGRQGGVASILVGLLKAAAFVAAALLAARYLVPRLLNVVAATRRRETFLLTIILLCLGTAWASSLVGLSLALGAFIAGLVLADSEYSYQALGEVLPLREVFNSLFFISIGMLFDVRTVVASPLLVAGAVLGVVLLKSIVTGGTALVLGQPLRVAVVAGLLLAQIGEFSFVLATEGVRVGLLSRSLDQIFLATAVGTMAITPALGALGPRLAARLERHAPRLWTARRPAAIGAAAERGPPRDHVIIAGFGFNGRSLARVLRSMDIPYVVIEFNPVVVRNEQRAGEPVIYGDAANEQILEHAGVEHARVMVVAISDASATRGAIAAAHRLNPGVHIVARARYMRDMQSLVALGTSEVIPEEFETAIEIFSRVLRRYLVPRETIEQRIRDVRHEYYEMFRPLPDAATRVEEIGRFLTDVTMAVFPVGDESAVAGASLAESRLRERTGATVVAIQKRAGGLSAVPAANALLETGDRVLLFGRPEQLALAGGLLRGHPSEVTT